MEVEDLQLWAGADLAHHQFKVIIACLLRPIYPDSQKVCEVTLISGCAH